MQFLFDLAILLFAAKMLGLLAKKIGAPEVVGEIMAGLILGPAVFNLVQDSDFLSKMAEIGVIMLMFEAGLGTDLKELKKTGLKATLIACAGVAVPMILGTILFMSFYGFAAPGSPEFLKGLFIGTIMSATSVSITVAALKELGKLNDTVGTTITSAAIIDDVIGIVVLTVVISMSGASSEAGLGTVIIKVVLFFVIAIISGYLIYKGMVWLDSNHPHTRRIPIVSLCYCFLLGFVAEQYFGIADITGAYVAGVILCNLSDRDYIESKVDVSSYMVFAPLFFAGIGLKTSISSMNGLLLLFSICFVLVALIGKVIGCGLCSRISGFNGKDSLKIGIGMMARGEVALITAQKGLSAGLLTSDYFTAVILLILASSIITPILLKRQYREPSEKICETADMNTSESLSASESSSDLDD
ncbi:MAG: cation:proton antiporter [Lachnospiraceae bacterium]|nr:cation:proton antiporter [Lachnospiraceae bacterium]